MQVIAIATVAGLFLGCATPLTVIGSTSRGKEVKFLYQQQTASGLNTGVTRCKMGKKGALKGCKDVKINFEGN